MQFVIDIPHDFSFLATIQAHGWMQLPPFGWLPNSGVLTYAYETPSGSVAALRISEAAGGLTVDVEGSEQQDRVERRVRRILQLDRSLHEFHTYCRSDSKLSHIPEKRLGRMLRSSTLWEDTVKVIATSNTTWTQTLAMTTRLTQEFGRASAHDDTVRAFPTPQRIAAVPFDEFASRARMGYRNTYVHTMATDIANGALDLESLQEESLTTAALRKRLLALPGIGPYGAACLMLYLGRPEHVNVDSWARMLLSKELGRTVSDKEVAAFFAEYGAWSGLVYMFYPWKAEAPASKIEGK